MTAVCYNGPIYFRKGASAVKKRKLTRAETVSVASMLFGLFFGAGNLIFPAYMGQAAGRNVLPALGGRTCSR